MPPPETLTSQIELVIDARTGEVRQAGTSAAGKVIEETRRQAERSLYFFGKVVMGYDLLTPTLHMPLCNTLQTSPPYRKLVLFPRGHLKTTVLKSMCLHALIQPDGTNVYFPKGIGALSHSLGTSTRIVLASKTASLASDTLGEIMQAYETNQLLKALWPHAVWDNPRRQSSAWNQERITLPRRDIFKEASIETVGVGGQITGYHFNMHVFDDHIDIGDANSPTTMATAIEWWKASRALMDDPDKTLEYTVGTRWAVADLYEYIMKNDPSVEPLVRRVIEDGVPIFPERYSLDTIRRLERELQTLFPLLFMNNAADPSLIDFNMECVRRFFISDGKVCFDENTYDALAEERAAAAKEIAAGRSEADSQRARDGGARDSSRKSESFNWDVLVARNDYLKFRHPKVE